MLRHHLQRRGRRLVLRAPRGMVHQVGRVRLLLGPVVAARHRLEVGGVVRARVRLGIRVMGGAVTA